MGFDWRLVAIRRRGSQGDPRERGADRRLRLHQALGLGAGRHCLPHWFITNKLPRVGRINLTYELTEAGTTRTEFSIVRRGKDGYYLVSAGVWTAYDADYQRKAADDCTVRGGGAVLVRDVTAQWDVFALAGPNSRTLLMSLVRDAERETVLSNKRFPWLSIRDFKLLMCPTVALRVAHTGELGRELHHPIEMQTFVFDRLMEAGEPLGP